MPGARTRKPKPKPPTLVGGPYASPLCRIGADFPCLVHGDSPVAGLTDAPIQWPFRRPPRGRRQLLVSGDLERAIRVESVLAVAYHWGVSRWTVERWRRALGVGRMTAGTARLWVDLVDVRLGKPRKWRGGSGPIYKIDDKAIVAILRRAAKGESQSVLAREYKVSRQYVGQLVAGRRRQHASNAPK